MASPFDSMARRAIEKRQPKLLRQPRCVLGPMGDVIPVGNGGGCEAVRDISEELARYHQNFRDDSYERKVL